ncbi:MAG: ATP-binding protein [Actinobacteria bacterium]|nr:ATP-binding protein [Actinomycetota bacterium]
MKDSPVNPFRFGALALDESFTDREREREELVSDIRNGQDVVLYAPRRLGKSSLVWSAAQAAAADGVLVAQVDLMTTPSKERLAAALAATIFEQIASPLERVKEAALAPFRRLQVQPTVIVEEDGSYAFSFGFGERPSDIDATLERLFRLPGELAGARHRRAALVMDEFQQVVEIDPGLPNLMRAVFQQQPEVGHVYLGSRRHVMEGIFNDRNEPFWRSAKTVELGPIDPVAFAPFLVDRFDASGKAVSAAAVAAVLGRTSGHPYATQELCYFLWERTSPGAEASEALVSAALEDALRSEHAHFSLLWEDCTGNQKLVLEALAREAGHPFSAAYRRRLGLGPATNVQRALRTLEKREIVTGDRGAYRIAEPFLPEWLLSRR